MASDKQPEVAGAVNVETQKSAAQTEFGPNEKLPVVVFGDLQLSTTVAEEPSHLAEESESKSSALNEPNWDQHKQRRLSRIRRPAGIWLLETALKAATSDLADVDVKAFPPLPLKQGLVDFDFFVRNFCPESSARLFLFPRKKGDKKSDDQVFRINESDMWVHRSEPPGGTQPPPPIRDCVAEAREYFSLKEAHGANGSAGDASPGARGPIVVLWDRNNGFRHNWTEPVAGKGADRGKGQEISDDLQKFLLDAIGRKGTIVWQRSAPCEQRGDPLWEMMLADTEAGKKLRENTVAIVRSECLRRMGLRVAQETSIEQVIEDIVDQLDASGLQQLARCRDLVIWLQEGAILISQANPGLLYYFYCPNSVDAINSTDAGRMTGYTVILTCALVKELAASHEADPIKKLETIRRGIRLGVVLTAAHYYRGFANKEDLGKEGSFPKPFESLFRQRAGR